MNKETKENIKKYSVVTGAAVLGGLAVFAGMSISAPEPVDVESIQNASYKEGVESVSLPDVEGIKMEAFNAGVESVEPVEVVREVNITKEVFVEDERLSQVMDLVYDNDGDISFITDELDSDEVDMIVENLIYGEEVKTMAYAFTKNELFDEIDRESVTLKDNSSMKLDEDDLEKLRIDNDSNELIFVDTDFEDKDFEVKVTGRFEQDDVDFEFEAVVEIEDGEVEGFKRIEIKERN